MSDDLVKRLREGTYADYDQCTNAWQAADRIEQLEAALQKMLAKCTWTRREKWCGCIDCHCVIARAALEGEKDETL